MTDLQGVVDYNPVALGVNKVFGHSGLLTNLSNFISNTLFRNASKSVENFFFTVGAVAITYKILKTCYGTFNTWKWVPTHFANKKKFNESDLTEKYGKCYAVVTGCTEGIGLSYVI